MRGDVLSASMRIANRRVRLSSGMFGPPLFVPERGHQYTSAVFGLPERGSRSGLETVRLADQFSHRLVLPFRLTLTLKKSHSPRKLGPTRFGPRAGARPG